MFGGVVDVYIYIYIDTYTHTHTHRLVMGIISEVKCQISL
jgi:hypothetical protein